MNSSQAQELRVWGRIAEIQSPCSQFDVRDSYWNTVTRDQKTFTLRTLWSVRTITFLCIGIALKKLLTDGCANCSLDISHFILFGIEIWWAMVVLSSYQWLLTYPHRQVRTAIQKFSSLKRFNSGLINAQMRTQGYWVELDLGKIEHVWFRLGDKKSLGSMNKYLPSVLLIKKFDQNVELREHGVKRRGKISIDINLFGMVMQWMTRIIFGCFKWSLCAHNTVEWRFESPWSNVKVSLIKY